jgi:selenocysteine lyase/cysteine desulfurase
VSHLIAGLQAINGVQIYGITEPEQYDQRVPTVICNVAAHAPDAIAAYLASKDIYVWDGDYYAVAVMERLGLADHDGAVRIGLAHYNTIAEVDRLLDALNAL